MLRSIGKQSGESVESVRKKKRKATVGRISKKRKEKSSLRPRVIAKVNVSILIL